MKVIKDDGNLEEFNINKIINAVNKAFKSCNKEMPQYLYSTLNDLFNTLEGDTISIKDIQDKVENILMNDKHFDVAKSYIIYREKHRKTRENAIYKLKFIENYINSDNTANATIDDNSNVANRNIAVLNSEIHKEDNREVNLRMLRDKVKELYPNFNYKQMDIDFNTIAYLHDSSSQIGMPYCVAITMYPFLINGIKDLGGLSAAPKNIDSFCGMFVNLVFAIASQFKGACMYKNQELLINGKLIKIKDFISKFELSNKFISDNSEWEYADLSQNSYYTQEEKKSVKILKVYRRKYSDKIYNIKSKTGLCCNVSKDHKFKVIRKGIIEEIKAKDLKLYDTVFVNKNISNILDTNSIESSLGKYELDVITDISTFHNDDEYVYEIETSTHWYNCGGFITHNCATPGVLLCMDYFLRKEWGDNYYLKSDIIINNEYCKRKQTIKEQIHQYFQQIVYSLMQPSGSRGNQSVFWNLSIFDKPFFDTMYGDFYFPDGSRPQWESLKWLQKDFLHWFNQERLKCILTFPVVSLCLIYKDNKFVDEDLYEFACKEYSEGNSFFTYISDSADSLSSCCRLSSKLSKPQFNFTNGQLSEMTGSKNVITLNLNRIIQDWYNDNCWMSDNLGDHKYKREFIIRDPNKKESLKQYLINILKRVYKYQIAYNECLKYLKENKLLPVYDAGFIDMKKQYLTIGINGLNQAAEFLGMKCNRNKEYEEFCNLIFTTIKEQNQLHKTKELMFNTEFTPCESASIKLYNKDKKDGYWVPEDTNLYASYIFKPNDPDISILDKIYLHGRNFCGDNLDGGSAAHLNLDSHLSEKQYRLLLKYAAQEGCKYFTFNIPNCECDDCGFIAKQPFKKCPKCGSTNVSLWDRVIGYLTKIKNWSAGRQLEQKTRVYSKITKVN